MYVCSVAVTAVFRFHWTEHPMCGMPVSGRQDTPQGRHSHITVRFPISQGSGGGAPPTPQFPQCCPKDSRSGRFRHTHTYITTYIKYYCTLSQFLQAFFISFYKIHNFCENCHKKTWKFFLKSYSFFLICVL